MFFRALPDRCLSEKGRRYKGGEHSKVRMTVAFIVSATGGKVTEPIVIWKSKIPRCFSYLEDKSRPANLHYFSSEKSWMNIDIMVKILSMLDAKMKSQNRNVIYRQCSLSPSGFKGQIFKYQCVLLAKEYNFASSTS